MSPKDTSPPIARRLKFARKEQNLSQKQLGILAGIDEFSASPRINQYEKGKHVPDFATTKRLADALSFPVTYFYADDENIANLIILFSKSNKEQQQHVIEMLEGK